MGGGLGVLGCWGVGVGSNNGLLSLPGEEIEQMG